MIYREKKKKSFNWRKWSDLNNQKPVYSNVVQFKRSYLKIKAFRNYHSLAAKCKGVS